MQLFTQTRQLIPSAQTKAGGSRSSAHHMGSVLSCCGLGDPKHEDHGDRQTERTPLLQDPTAILQQPRPEPTPEEHQRDQEALARIVDRTADNLINIQSTFDRRKNGQTLDAEEKAAHFKYLIERLQNSSTAPTSGISAEHDVAEEENSQMPIADIVHSEQEISEDERTLLDSTIKQFKDALQKETTIKPVGDILVKLDWNS